MAHLDARPPAVGARLVSTAIVGGGWAGLAAAVDLVDAGVVRRGDEVVLYEAAPAAGGRARAVTIGLAGERVEVDNGQHLMLGAYRECLRLIARVAGGEDAVLARHRMRLGGSTGLAMSAAPLPAPFHLLVALAGARGLSIGDRLAMAALMTRLRLARWRAPSGSTVAELLRLQRQPARLVQALWEPLCVGALNTAPEHACAQAFCAVLRDSLGATARASDFLLPRATLSDVFPRPAERWLRAHGVAVHLQSPVRGLTARGDHWWIDAGGRSQAARDVIVALAPHAAARLLDTTAATAGAGCQNALRQAVAGLQRFEHERIATVYLAWPAQDAPALRPWWMLREDPARHEHGQWIFDRGVIGTLRIAAIVISARGRAADLDDEALGVATARQVAAQLGCPLPADHRVIDEKRATFRCTPHRPRLSPILASAPGPRLVLAGDYLGDYPATLESAVRSGAAAARALTQPR